jgi:hypothetical protein
VFNPDFGTSWDKTHTELKPPPGVSTSADKFNWLVCILPAGTIPHAVATAPGLTPGLLRSEAWIPLLHLGSSGGVVAKLQQVPTQQAYGHWEVRPRSVSDILDTSTFVVVQGFQQWN